MATPRHLIKMKLMHTIWCSFSHLPRVGGDPVSTTQAAYLLPLKGEGLGGKFPNTSWTRSASPAVIDGAIKFEKIELYCI